MKPTGRTYEGVSVAGMFVPINSEKFITLKAPEDPSRFMVPIFSDMVKLRAAMEMLSIPVDRVYTVGDEEEFMRTMYLAGYRVVLDVYKTPSGHIRFIDLRLQAEGHSN